MKAWLLRGGLAVGLWSLASAAGAVAIPHYATLHYTFGTGTTVRSGVIQGSWSGWRSHTNMVIESVGGPLPGPTGCVPEGTPAPLVTEPVTQVSFRFAPAYGPGKPDNA